VATLAERPSGTKVHLEILPGDPLDYVEAMRRSHLLGVWGRRPVRSTSSPT
jgi:hypothetical protein